MKYSTASRRLKAACKVNIKLLIGKKYFATEFNLAI